MRMGESVDEGIGSWVTRRAELLGERDAYSFRGESVTFAAFEERTNALAGGLRQLGVHRGDRVAMLLVNSADFLDLMFAVAKLGAITVPVNTRLAAAEVGFILADSGADVFAYHAPLAGVARAALAEPGVRVRHRVLSWGEPADGELTLAEVRAAGSSRRTEADVSETDVAGLMYTSGTTGRPKGAMLTHANLWWNAINTLVTGRGLREGDRTVTVAPMFHIGGLGVHTLPLIYVGGTSVIQAAFDPAETLAEMARSRATVQFLVPAMWAAIARVPDFDNYDLSALELAVSGGAPCPLTVIEFFRRRGLPFQEGFGMTETAPLVSVLDADHVAERAGSIGRAVMHVQARIVDEQDADVAVDAVGELALRGRNIFVGYWGRAQATAEAFRGGWFHTGDLGRMDAQGFITLVDRKKDMIISGGENVYPIEVEQVIYRHPGVEEAAVVGIPDERWGELVVAVVVRRMAAGDGGDAAGDATAELTAGELLEFCRERLSHFKCPRRVEFVEALPRNATGKVLKTELRSQVGGVASAVSR